MALQPKDTNMKNNRQLIVGILISSIALWVGFYTLDQVKHQDVWMIFPLVFTFGAIFVFGIFVAVSSE